MESVNTTPANLSRADIAEIGCHPKQLEIVLGKNNAGYLLVISNTKTGKMISQITTERLLLEKAIAFTVNLLTYISRNAADEKSWYEAVPCPIRVSDQSIPNFLTAQHIKTIQKKLHKNQHIHTGKLLS